MDLELTNQEILEAVRSLESEADDTDPERVTADDGFKDLEVRRFSYFYY